MIPNTQRRSPVYVGNGAATEYAFEFKVTDASTLVVTTADADDLNAAELVYESDYTVTLNADQSTSPGGSVTYSGLPVDHRLVITTRTPNDQPGSITNLGAFHASVLEGMIDRVAIQNQQQQEQLERCVKVGVTSEQDPSALLQDSIDLAANSASAAAGSASAAAGSALAASGSASAAAGSASAASGSASAASGSASNASTSESNAQAYRNAAEGFRNAAEGFRNEASGSASAASGSASEAAASLSDFQSRYLGAYAAPPTVDENGVPVQRGALYFDTVAMKLRVFDPTNLAPDPNTFTTWTQLNFTVTVNDAVAPDGTLTASKLTEDTSTTQRNMYHSATVPAGKVFGTKVRVLPSGNRKAYTLYLHDTLTLGVSALVDFNLDTKQVASIVNGANSTGFASVRALADGWLELTVSLVATVDTTGIRCRHYFSNSLTGDGNATYVGDGVSYVHAWGADTYAVSAAGWADYDAAAQAAALTASGHATTATTKAGEASASADLAASYATTVGTQSFRNKLINGNFAINQRGYAGGATSSANQYTCDRWRVVTSGQTAPRVASGNGYRVTAPAGGYEQVIEGANIEGGVYTLSWVGTATATVNGVAIANGGQTAALPANTNVTIRFTGGTVEKAQFEVGNVATPFEQRPIGLELSLCQWYYETTEVTSELVWSGNAAGGSAYYVSVRFAVAKRALPDVVCTVGVPINFPASDPTLPIITRGGFRALTPASSGSATGFYPFGFTADAEIY